MKGNGRAAQRKRNLKESDFPQLWILCPTVSAEVLALFGAEEKEGWPQGVYFAPDGYKMAIVVLNQLPETPETLWLRMLGKGKVQRRAFAELNTLPEEEPLAKKIKDVVLRWYSAIQGKKPENAEEEELIMELITSYEEWQKATLQQGLQQGLEQGRVQTQRQFIENFLMARFGAIDETLASAIEPLLKLSMERLTRLMLELSSLEQDEFLARLSREPELQQPDVDNSNPSP